ncbi:TetR family transcriptional regulator [Parasphingorhabdus halotolerans]|uniref:TetR/AcrR family transcriptional regulator n=1 Tax=Parasphingorhabdus halotolerans TaxID=2725558 RepID=A0A6H2DR10_9SPHN|nr:TetR family transcriptional regulator [Parasphingorhabdus halotolerans]QJB70201.1 TetR/AcrR family transcriptional regulator [Parasphingorhabdus halotolerans]
MPRPETDIEAGREKLIHMAETIIRERGAISFTITDLAAEAGMSQSNVYRFFENKDQLAEVMAGRWFAELIAIIEDLVETEMPAEQKLYEFFARRLVIKRARFEEDPDLFRSYMELGDQHFEVIRGYVDLTDHYMASILAEAMEAGYFEGLELDAVVSLVNTMVQPFCNPNLMMNMMHLADEGRLRQVIDTILTGLKARDHSVSEKPALHIAH